MTQTNSSHPTFNLWVEPWITVERPDGTRDTLNIPQTITGAHQIRALYDPSPLVTVAIHRLLLAILQEVINPQNRTDLKRVWQAGQFTAEQLQPFAEKYAHRFDLFSPTAPFLQSADLPLQPEKKNDGKPISYLMPEEPAGTGVTHYTHAYDDHQRLCSACVAKGLLMIPAFASSGGAGIKPSVNGVPPIYVIPGGKTLFESLAASLTIPKYQPPDFEPDPARYDLPWWKHDPVIAKKEEIQRAGYLQSLTFPARRTRLHPIPAEQQLCTRCGQITSWHAATMIYEMGESRPKDASWWRDPFAAYRQPKKETDTPLPIRPVEGRAMWREFAGFVLPNKKDEKGQQAYRPAILNQLEDVGDFLPYGDDAPIPLRLVGIRTDMKMKIFEWQESGFAVPPRLLSDLESAKFIEDGLEFAKQCDTTIKSTFRQFFGGGGKTKRFESVTIQMSRRYWQELGLAFHTHLQQYTAAANGQELFEDWLTQVVNKAKEVFEEAVESVPVEGYLKKPGAVKDYKSVKRPQLSKLRLRQEAIDECSKWLNISRKKLLPREETQ
jgi:CRISPR system Cascade subunit CasA